MILVKSAQLKFLLDVCLSRIGFSYKRWLSSFNFFLLGLWVFAETQLLAASAAVVHWLAAAVAIVHLVGIIGVVLFLWIIFWVEGLLVLAGAVHDTL